MNDSTKTDARFDPLLRTLAVAPSRRDAVRLLVATMLGWFGLPRVADAHDLLTVPGKETGRRRGRP